MVRDRKLRQFQLSLVDSLHSLTSPDAIVQTAVRMLATHLNAEGCWYAEIDNDEAFAVVEEFYPVETGDSGQHQGEHEHLNHFLADHDVTSIEQGLRQSVTAVS